MAHALNLLDASFTRRRVALDSRAAASAVVAALALSVASTAWLKASTARIAATTSAAEAEVAARPSPVAGVPAVASRETSELARLRAIDAGQRNVLAALESGAGGTSQPYSEYLLALSRQARGSLWITGFGVGADGRALEVSGRMTDPQRLPEYLRRLNDEPLFKGRQFAQLSVRTVDASGASSESATGSPSIEFALRAIAAAGTAP